MWNTAGEVKTNSWVMFSPSHGCISVSRPKRTYLQQLCTETGCRLEDLPEVMDDREKWWERERFREVCISSMTWWCWDIYQAFGLMSRVFTNGLRDWGSIPGWVIQKTKKMGFDAALLNTQYYIRYRSRVKWSNPRNAVASSPTPWCSIYWKGSLRVTLN